MSVKWWKGQIATSFYAYAQTDACTYIHTMKKIICTNEKHL